MDPQILADLLDTFGTDVAQGRLPWSLEGDITSFGGIGEGLRFEANGREWRVLQVGLAEDDMNQPAYRTDAQMRDAARVLPPVCFAPLVSQYTRLLRDPRWSVAQVPAIMSAMLHDAVLFHVMDTNPFGALSEYRVTAMTRWWGVMAKPALRYDNNTGRPLMELIAEEEADAEAPQPAFARADAVTRGETGGATSTENNQPDKEPDGVPESSTVTNNGDDHREMMDGPADTRMPIAELRARYRDIKTVLTLIAATSAPYRCSRPQNAAVSGCTARLVFCKDPSTIYLGLLLNTVLRELPRKVVCSMPVFRVIAEGWGSSPSLLEILQAAWEEYQDVVGDIRALLESASSAVGAAAADTTTAAATHGRLPGEQTSHQQPPQPPRRLRRALPRLHFPSQPSEESEASQTRDSSSATAAGADSTANATATAGGGSASGSAGVDYGIPLGGRERGNVVRVGHPTGFTTTRLEDGGGRRFQTGAATTAGVGGPGLARSVFQQLRDGIVTPGNNSNNTSPMTGAGVNSGDDAGRGSADSSGSTYRTEDAGKICLESMRECAQSPEMLLWWARCRLLAFQLLDSSSRVGVESTRSLEYFRQLWTCAPLAREILEDDQEALLSASLDVLHGASASASGVKEENEEAEKAAAAPVHAQAAQLTALQRQARRLYANLVGTIADLSKFWFSVRVSQTTLNAVASSAPENNVIWSIVNATVPPRRRFQREEFMSYAEHWQYALLVDDYVTQPMGFRVSTRGRTMVTQLLHVLSEYPTFYPALVTRTLAMLNRREMIMAELNGRLVAAVARCLRFYLPTMPPVLAVPTAAAEPGHAAEEAARASAAAEAASPEDVEVLSPFQDPLPSSSATSSSSSSSSAPSAEHARRRGAREVENNSSGESMVPTSGPPSSYSPPSEHLGLNDDEGEGAARADFQGNRESQRAAPAAARAENANTNASADGGDASTSGLNYEAYVAVSDTDEEMDEREETVLRYIEDAAENHNNSNNAAPHSDPLRHPRLRRRAARRAAAARRDVLRQQHEDAMPILTTKAYDAISTCIDVLRMLVRNAHLSVNPMGILFTAPTAAAAAAAAATAPTVGNGGSSGDDGRRGSSAVAESTADAEDVGRSVDDAPRGAAARPTTASATPAGEEADATHTTNTTAATAHRSPRFEPSLPKSQCDLYTLLHQLVFQTRYGPLATAALRFFSACVHYNVRDMVPVFAERGLLNTVLTIARRPRPSTPPSSRRLTGRQEITKCNTMNEAETAPPFLFALDMLEENGQPNIPPCDSSLPPAYRHQQQRHHQQQQEQKLTSTASTAELNPLLTTDPSPALLVRYIPHEDPFLNSASIRLVLPEFVEAMTVHQATHVVFRKHLQWIPALLQSLTVTPALSTTTLSDIQGLWQEEEEEKEVKKEAESFSETHPSSGVDARFSAKRQENEEEESVDKGDARKIPTAGDKVAVVTSTAALRSATKREAQHAQLRCRSSPMYKQLLHELLSSCAAAQTASGDASSNSASVDGVLIRLVELCRLHLKREEVGYKFLQGSVKDMSRVLTEVLQPSDILSKTVKPAMHRELTQLGESVWQFAHAVRSGALRPKPFALTSYTTTSVTTDGATLARVPAAAEASFTATAAHGESASELSQDSAPRSMRLRGQVYKPTLTTREDFLQLLVRATELCRTFNNFFAFFSAMDWSGQRRGPRLARNNLERQEGIQALKDILNGTVDKFHRSIEQLWSLMGCQVPLQVSGRPLSLCEQGVANGESSLLSYVQAIIGQSVHPRILSDYFRTTLPSAALEEVLGSTVNCILHHSTRSLFYLRSPENARSGGDGGSGAAPSSATAGAGHLEEGCEQRAQRDRDFRRKELHRMLQADAMASTREDGGAAAATTSSAGDRDADEENATAALASCLPHDRSAEQATNAVGSEVPAPRATTGAAGSSETATAREPVRFSISAYPCYDYISSVMRPLSMGDGIFLRQLLEAWRATTAGSGNSSGSGSNAGVFGGVTAGPNRRDADGAAWRRIFGEVLRHVVDAAVVRANFCGSDVRHLLRSLRSSSLHAGLSNAVLSLYDRSAEAGAALDEGTEEGSSGGGDALHHRPHLSTSHQADPSDQLMQSLLQDSRSYVAEPATAWMTTAAWQEATTGCSATAADDRADGAAPTHREGPPLTRAGETTGADAATSAAATAVNVATTSARHVDPAAASVPSAEAADANPFTNTLQASHIPTTASAQTPNPLAVVPSRLEDVIVHVDGGEARQTDSQGSVLSSDASSSSALLTPTHQTAGAVAGVPTGHAVVHDAGIVPTSTAAAAAAAAATAAAPNAVVDRNVFGSTGANGNTTASTAENHLTAVVSGALPRRSVLPPLFTPLNPVKALQQWVFMTLFNGRRSNNPQSMNGFSHITAFRRDSRTRAVLPLHVAALVQTVREDLTTAYAAAVEGVYADAVTRKQCHKRTTALREQEPEKHARTVDEVVAARRQRRAASAAHRSRHDDDASPMDDFVDSQSCPWWEAKPRELARMPLPRVRNMDVCLLDINLAAAHRVLWELAVLDAVCAGGNGNGNFQDIDARDLVKTLTYATQLLILLSRLFLSPGTTTTHERPRRAATTAAEQESFNTAAAAAAQAVVAAQSELRRCLVYMGVLLMNFLEGCDSRARGQHHVVVESLLYCVLDVWPTLPGFPMLPYMYTTAVDLMSQLKTDTFGNVRLHRLIKDESAAARRKLNGPGKEGGSADSKQGRAETAGNKRNGTQENNNSSSSSSDGDGEDEENEQNLADLFASPSRGDEEGHNTNNASNTRTGPNAATRRNIPWSPLRNPYFIAHDQPNPRGSDGEDGDEEGRAGRVVRDVPISGSEEEPHRHIIHLSQPHGADFERRRAATRRSWRDRAGGSDNHDDDDDEDPTNTLVAAPDDLYIGPHGGGGGGLTHWVSRLESARRGVSGGSGGPRVDRAAAAAAAALPSVHVWERMLPWLCDIITGTVFPLNTLSEAGQRMLRRRACKVLWSLWTATKSAEQPYVLAYMLHRVLSDARGNVVLLEYMAVLLSQLRGVVAVEALALTPLPRVIVQVVKAAIAAVAAEQSSWELQSEAEKLSLEHTATPEEQHAARERRRRRRRAFAATQSTLHGQLISFLTLFQDSRSDAPLVRDRFKRTSAATNPAGNPHNAQAMGTQCNYFDATRNTFCWHGHQCHRHHAVPVNGQRGRDGEDHRYPLEMFGTGTQRVVDEVLTVLELHGFEGAPLLPRGGREEKSDGAGKGKGGERKNAGAAGQANDADRTRAAAAAAASTTGVRTAPRNTATRRYPSTHSSEEEQATRRRPQAAGHVSYATVNPRDPVTGEVLPPPFMPARTPASGTEAEEPVPAPQTSTPPQAEIASNEQARTPASHSRRADGAEGEDGSRSPSSAALVRHERLTPHGFVSMMARAERQGPTEAGEGPSAYAGRATTPSAERQQQPQQPPPERASPSQPRAPSRHEAAENAHSTDDNSGEARALARSPGRTIQQQQQQHYEQQAQRLLHQRQQLESLQRDLHTTQRRMEELHRLVGAVTGGDSATGTAAANSTAFAPTTATEPPLPFHWGGATTSDAVPPPPPQLPTSGRGYAPSSPELGPVRHQLRNPLDTRHRSSGHPSAAAAAAATVVDPLRRAIIPYFALFSRELCEDVLRLSLDFMAARLRDAAVEKAEAAEEAEAGKQQQQQQGGRAEQQPSPASTLHSGVMMDLMHGIRGGAAAAEVASAASSGAASPVSPASPLLMADVAVPSEEVGAAAPHTNGNNAPAPLAAHNVTAATAASGTSTTAMSAAAQLAARLRLPPVEVAECPVSEVMVHFLLSCFFTYYHDCLRVVQTYCPRREVGVAVTGAAADADTDAMSVLSAYVTSVNLQNREKNIILCELLLTDMPRIEDEIWRDMTRVLATAVQVHHKAQKLTEKSYTSLTSFHEKRTQALAAAEAKAAGAVSNLGASASTRTTVAAAAAATEGGAVAAGGAAASGSAAGHRRTAAWREATGQQQHHRRTAAAATPAGPALPPPPPPPPPAVSAASGEDTNPPAWTSTTTETKPAGVAEKEEMVPNLHHYVVPVGIFLANLEPYIVRQPTAFYHALQRYCEVRWVTGRKGETPAAWLGVWVQPRLQLPTTVEAPATAPTTATTPAPTASGGKVSNTTAVEARTTTRSTRAASAASNAGPAPASRASATLCNAASAVSGGVGTRRSRAAATATASPSGTPPMVHTALSSPPNVPSRAFVARVSCFMQHLARNIETGAGRASHGVEILAAVEQLPGVCAALLSLTTSIPVSQYYASILTTERTEPAASPSLVPAATTVATTSTNSTTTAIGNPSTLHDVAEEEEEEVEASQKPLQKQKKKQPAEASSRLISIPPFLALILYFCGTLSEADRSNPFDVAAGIDFAAGLLAYNPAVVSDAVMGTMQRVVSALEEMRESVAAAGQAGESHRSTNDDGDGVDAGSEEEEDDAVAVVTAEGSGVRSARATTNLETTRAAQQETLADRQRRLTRCLHDLLCFIECGSPRPATAALPARQRAAQQMSGGNAVQEAFLRFHKYLAHRGLLPLLFRVCRLRTCQHGRDATALLQLLHHQLLAYGEYKMATVLAPGQRAYALEQQQEFHERQRQTGMTGSGASLWPPLLATGGRGASRLEYGRNPAAIFHDLLRDRAGGDLVGQNFYTPPNVGPITALHNLFSNVTANAEEEEEARARLRAEIDGAEDDEVEEEEEEEEHGSRYSSETSLIGYPLMMAPTHVDVATPELQPHHPGNGLDLTGEAEEEDGNAAMQEMWEPIVPVRRVRPATRGTTRHAPPTRPPRPADSVPAEASREAEEGRVHEANEDEAAHDAAHAWLQPHESAEENEEGDDADRVAEAEATAAVGADAGRDGNDLYDEDDWEDYVEASDINTHDDVSEETDEDHHGASDRRRRRRHQHRRRVSNSDDAEEDDHAAVHTQEVSDIDVHDAEDDDEAAVVQQLPQEAEAEEEDEEEHANAFGGQSNLSHVFAPLDWSFEVREGGGGEAEGEEEEETDEETDEEGADDEEDEEDSEQQSYGEDGFGEAGEESYLDDSTLDDRYLNPQIWGHMLGHRHHNGGVGGGAGGNGNGGRATGVEERAQTFAACAYHAILLAVRPLHRGNVVETEGPALPVLHASEEEEASLSTTEAAAPAATTAAAAAAAARDEGASHEAPTRPVTAPRLSSGFGRMLSDAIAHADAQNAGQARLAAANASLSPPSMRDRTPSEQLMRRTQDSRSPLASTPQDQQAQNVRTAATDMTAPAVASAPAPSSEGRDGEPVPERQTSPPAVEAAAHAEAPTLLSATPTATIATATGNNNTNNNNSDGNATGDDGGLDAITARILALFAGTAEAAPAAPPRPAAPTTEATAASTAEPPAAAPAEPPAEPAAPAEPEPWEGVLDVQFLNEMPEDVRSEILFDSMQVLRGGTEREVLGQRTRLYPGFLRAMPESGQRHAMEVEARWVRVTRADDNASEFYQTIVSVDAETRRDLLLQCDLELLQPYPELLREANELRAAVARERAEQEAAQRAQEEWRQRQREQQVQQALQQRNPHRWVNREGRARAGEEADTPGGAGGPAGPGRATVTGPAGLPEMETVDGVMEMLYHGTGAMYSIVNHELFLARRMYRCEGVLQRLNGPSTAFGHAMGGSAGAAAGMLGSGGSGVPAGGLVMRAGGMQYPTAAAPQSAWVMSPLMDDDSHQHDMTRLLRHGGTRGGNALRRTPPPLPLTRSPPAVLSSTNRSNNNPGEAAEGVSGSSSPLGRHGSSQFVTSASSSSPLLAQNSLSSTASPLSPLGFEEAPAASAGPHTTARAPTTAVPVERVPSGVPTALAALSESIVPVQESPYHPLSLPLPEVPDDVLFDCLELLRLRATAALSLPYNATAGISCLDQQLQHLLQLLMGNQLAASRLVCQLLDVMANTVTTAEGTAEAVAAAATTAPAVATQSAPTAAELAANQMFIKGATVFLVSLMKQNQAMAASFFLLPDGAMNAETLKPVEAPLDATERRCAEYGLWNRLWKVCRQHVHVQGFLYSLDQLLRQLLRSQKMFHNAAEDREVTSPDDPLADEPLSPSLILHPRHPHRLRWTNIRRLSNYEEGGYVCNVCGVNPGYDYCFHCPSCQFDLCPSCSRERLTLSEMQVRISRSSALLLMAVPETVTSMTAFLRHPLCRPNIAASVVQLMSRGLQECAARERTSPLSSNSANAATFGAASGLSETAAASPLGHNTGGMGAATGSNTSSVPSFSYTSSNNRGPAHAAFSPAGPLQLLELELVQMAETRVRAMKEARDAFRQEVYAILHGKAKTARRASASGLPSGPSPASAVSPTNPRGTAALTTTTTMTTTTATAPALTTTNHAAMAAHAIRQQLSIPDGYIFDTDTAMALLVKLDIKDGEGDAMQRLFEPYVATNGAEPRAFTMLWRASQAYLHDVTALLEHLTPQEVLPLPSCVSNILQTFCRYHFADANGGAGGGSNLGGSARTLTGSRSNLAGETEHFLRASTKPSSVSDRAVRELAEQEDAAQWVTAVGTRLSDEGLNAAEEQQRRLPHVVRMILEENRVTLNTLLHWDSSLLKENFAFLKYEPNLIDFNFKLSDFRRRLGLRRGSNILLRVKRENCLLDSFKELQKQKSLGGQLHVRFEGEEGADAGGLTREWLQILSEALVDERYALFVHSQDSASFQPNPFSSVNPNHLDYFQFAGVVVALAITHNVPIDIHFTRAFYRHIIGHRPVFADLQSFDQELYTNLNWIMENDVTNLALTFAVNYNRFGSVEEEELEPNGKNTMVTNANKQQYVRLLCEFHMTKRTEEQLLRFLKGFYSVIPRREIQCFTENELELVISGMPDIDVEDLRTHTVYEGYSSTSPQIRWFWEAVSTMTKEDLANLLQFTTGSSKVPHGGFGHLEGSNGRSLPFTISRWAVNKDDLLPQAHTCFNKIDLPVYASAAVLKEKLMLAITYGSMGFTMV